MALPANPVIEWSAHADQVRTQIFIEEQPHRHQRRRLRGGIDEESAFAIGGEGKHGEEIFVF